MPKSTKTPQSTTSRTRARNPRTTRETSLAPSLNHADDMSAASSLNHADIAHRAYELFLSSGAMHGRDLEHWLQAESELRDRSVTAGH
jgi:hypothetical protein